MTNGVVSQISLSLQQVSEAVSVAEFKAVAIGVVFRLVNDFSTCLPHGLLNWNCWQMVPFPIHVLQRISL